MAKKLYTFDEFLNREESDDMSVLFSTSNEINKMLYDIVSSEEFKTKLAATKDAREIAVLLFDSLDANLEIDSVKDLCYLSFLIGKALEGFIEVRSLLKLRDKVKSLSSKLNTENGAD